MKASSKDIKFYKGVLLEKIHTQLVSTGTFFSIDEVDEFLKDFAGLGGSCSKMTHDEMQVLKEYCKLFAHQIGLDIKDID